MSFVAAPAGAVESYDALLARAKSGDPTLDYRALRDAYFGGAWHTITLGFKPGGEAR